MVGPVSNLRFAQSIPEALGEPAMIGQEAQLTREAFMESFIGGIRAPALKIRGSRPPVGPRSDQYTPSSHKRSSEIPK